MNITPITQPIAYTGKMPLGKNVRVVSNPQNAERLRFAADLNKDVCSFNKSGSSLTPKFLRGLLKIEGKTPIETFSHIKDEILKAMGFKHPEALELLVVSPDLSEAAYNMGIGKVLIAAGEYSKEQIIKILCHELVHMEQFVKIYKAKGKNIFLETLFNISKQGNPDITMTDILANFNFDFYETMSKDVTVSYIEGEKYYKAMCEYLPITHAWSKDFRYFNNLLEKEAYAAERKALKALGKNPVVSADQFPSNYKTLINLLNDIGVPQEYYDALLFELNMAAHLKKFETPQNINKYIRIYKDFRDKKEVTSQDKAWWIKTYSKIFHLKSLTLKSVQAHQECYKQIEAWLSEGKYTIKDVLKNI